VSSINRILFILLLDKMTHKHLRTYISKNVKLTNKMCSYYDTGITFRRKNGSRSSNPEQQVFSKYNEKFGVAAAAVEAHQKMNIYMLIASRDFLLFRLF